MVDINQTSIEKDIVVVVTSSLVVAVAHEEGEMHIFELIALEETTTYTYGG